MKKIINKISICIVLAFGLAFISCDKDDATGKGTLDVATEVVGSINLTAPLTPSQTVKEAEEAVFSYTIKLNKPQSVPVKIYISQVGGTAGEDDFGFDNEITFPAYTTSATGTISILNDNLKEGDENIVLQIGDIKTANASLSPFKISFIIKDCFSNLGGTYSYVTTNCYTPGPPAGNAAGPFTGNVTFTPSSVSGEYGISDASFGGWLGLYGPQANSVNNTANGVILKDLCGRISYSGADQFQEIFTFTNLVINGSQMSFHWANDYGEYGDTKLTRTDGTNWPALTL